MEQLKEKVLKANLALPKNDLVTLTWGNVSGICREKNLIVIKPSGIEYDKLTTDDMVVLDLEGNKVEGRLNPSTDTDTHLHLYRSFKDIGSVVHTHSTWATIWAQAKRAIPAYGTTHADYFYGDVPLTRQLTETEVESSYELETGKVIVETLKDQKIDPKRTPGILVASHGPFSWGNDPEDAVYNAIVLEEIAKMAYHSAKLNPKIKEIEDHLLNKHNERKHGVNAYYGQNS